MKKFEIKKEYISLNGVTDVEIEQAENELGLYFSDDYKYYLKHFGVLSFDDHELTGILPSQRLNVVDVTKEEWNNNPAISHDYYVIEQSLIDGIVVWQDQNGAIYYSSGASNMKKIHDSLIDYINE